MTVLIVEDNPTVRKLIRRAAADVADTITECDDGAGSLAAYEMHRPDVVLIDVRMPGMDGLTATRLLLKHHPAARVVIFTDYSDEEVRSASFFNYFISIAVAEKIARMKVRDSASPAKQGMAIAGKEIGATVSLPRQPLQGCCREKLFELADRVIYEANSRGGNCVLRQPRPLVYCGFVELFAEGEVTGFTPGGQARNNIPSPYCCFVRHGPRALCSQRMRTVRRDGKQMTKKNAVLRVRPHNQRLHRRVRAACC